MSGHRVCEIHPLDPDDTSFLAFVSKPGESGDHQEGQVQQMRTLSAVKEILLSAKKDP